MSEATENNNEREVANVDFSVIEQMLPQRYQLVSLLGEGGVGAVFRVKDIESGTEFALKMLRPQNLLDAQALRRFENEARSAKHLSHPNIAAVYDYGFSECNAPYIVMELLTGKSLESIIKEEGALATTRVLDLFLQVAEAMEYAHGEGVIHRDLKPSNLIVQDAGDGVELIKIVDFGLAKTAMNESDKTQSGEIMGSPFYMSPEQCEGQTVDERSDIYAVGATLYEALSGRPPLVGVNPVDTLLKQLRDKPRSLCHFISEDRVSQQLSDVVDKALAKTKEQRYQRMNSFRIDLDNVRWNNAPVSIAETEIAVKPPGFLDRVGLASSRLTFKGFSTTFVFGMVIGFLIRLVHR